MGSADGSTDEAFAAAVKQVVADSPRSVRDSFVHAIATSPDELDSSLWGAPATRDDQRSAALENLRREFLARRAVIATAVTRAQAAELLDVSQQAVLNRLASGDLVGVRQGREWRLPAWQFSADLATGAVPGLCELTAVFPGGVVSLSEWVTTPNVDLDGAAPVAALARGRVGDVVRAARSLAAAAL